MSGKMIKIVKGSFVEEWVSYYEEDEEDIVDSLNRINGKFFIDGDFIYFTTKKYLSSKTLYQATFELGKNVGVIDYLSRNCFDNLGFMGCEVTSLLDDMHRFEYTISYDSLEIEEELAVFLLEYLDYRVVYSDKKEVSKEYLVEAIGDILSRIESLRIKGEYVVVELCGEPTDLKLFDMIINLLYGDIKDIFYNTYYKSNIELFFNSEKGNGNVMDEWDGDVWYLEPPIKDRLDF